MEEDKSLYFVCVFGREPVGVPEVRQIVNTQDYHWLCRGLANAIKKAEELAYKYPKFDIQYARFTDKIYVRQELERAGL